MNECNRFFAYRSIRMPLRRRVDEYMQHSFPDGVMYDDNEIINMLPIQLQVRAVLSLRFLTVLCHDSNR